MKQIFYILFLITCCTCVQAQYGPDYLIYKENPSTYGVTIYGDIITPYSEWNGKKIKILTDQGTLKYKAEEVSYFYADGVEYVSVPYENSRRFANVISLGEIKLAYYMSSGKSVNYTYGGGIIAGAVVGAVEGLIEYATSFFYFKTATCPDYIRIPHNSKLFKAKFAVYFENYPTIHQLLMKEQVSETEFLSAILITNERQLK
ncbi:hypothetical protein [Flammeovirga sp. EKP202]|uniref:hypothetical protein n=1 Tax=Flammeovirga sp. EKP202 TaxID=2770592 RepID=UPI00165FC22E|nr:hypothetical protein [Flammeovirga sp. EKP202]MBD0402065.1 hypothetical protein [Flammeovirga sp. EKP202]